MANNIDWTKNLTTDPAYGAVPTVTISDNTGFGYTVGGLNGATGSNTVWSTNTTATGSFTIGPSYSAIETQLDQSGRMSLRGENADLDINGKSLKHWMERVEERLNILTPNPELEKEWDDLRRLGQRYRALEKKCQEKARMWEALKKVQPKQS
jgi:hypothetical protein